MVGSIICLMVALALPFTFAQPTIIKFPTPTRGFTHWSRTGLTPHTRRSYTLHTAILDNPRDFSFEIPEHGCYNRQNTSATARAFNCIYSTNAGYFSFSGGCVGDLVINGTRIAEDAAPTNLNFILTDSEYVIGYTTLKSYRTRQAITAKGWLVHDGAPYVNNSKGIDINSKFATEKAPRTAVGLMPNGSVVLAQVDGVEVTKLGLDLFEWSRVLAEVVGVREAVNLDGGGSSVSVYEGKVISRPTCIDTPEPVCERAVTSITCMQMP